MPDVIHIHGTEDNFGLVQRFVKIPVLISIQGLLTVYTTKFYTGIPTHLVTQNETIFDIPNSLCEATLSRVAIIASACGETDSIVQPDVDAILLQSGDAYSLAAKIIALIKDPEKARSLANSARTKTLHRHNRERVRGELLKVYY